MPDPASDRAIAPTEALRSFLEGHEAILRRQLTWHAWKVAKPRSSLQKSPHQHLWVTPVWANADLRTVASELMEGKPSAMPRRGPTDRPLGEGVGGARPASSPIDRGQWIEMAAPEHGAGPKCHLDGGGWVASGGGSARSMGT